MLVLLQAVTSAIDKTLKPNVELESCECGLQEIEPGYQTLDIDGSSQTDPVAFQISYKKHSCGTQWKHGAAVIRKS